MNPIITKVILDEAGINLDNQDVDALLTHLNQTLEERVGTEITESLTDEQLEVLVNLQETGTDEDVADWLQNNVPELEQITQDAIDIIVGELAENADNINEA